MMPIPVIVIVIADLAVAGVAAFGLALVEHFLQRWEAAMHKKPESVSYRLSDSAPPYALIILVALVAMAVSTGCLVLRLIGVL